MPSFDQQLNELYTQNGRECGTYQAGLNILNKAGYFLSNKFFRNEVGKKAYLTSLRDHEFRKTVKKVKHKGWLVTFGGKPIHPSELKLSPPEKRPIFISKPIWKEF